MLGGAVVWYMCLTGEGELASRHALKQQSPGAVGSCTLIGVEMGVALVTDTSDTALGLHGVPPGVGPGEK